MEQVVATRLIYADVDGAEVRVEVRIGLPVQDGVGDWSSSYAFEAGERAIALKSGTGRGVDGVQALLNAFHGVGQALDRSGIEWAMYSAEEAAADGFSIREDGFPRAGLNVMFLGREFRDRIQAYVATETERAMKGLPGRT